MQVKDLQLKRVLHTALFVLLLGAAGMTKGYATEYATDVLIGDLIYTVINSTNTGLAYVKSHKDDTNAVGSLTIPSSVSYTSYEYDYVTGQYVYVTRTYTVVAILGGAFSGCSGLTGDLTIPNSVTSIGNGAFSYCSGFDGSLTIPNSVRSIGNYAFRNCSGLTGSLTIGNSVTSIGENAFYGCSGLDGSLTIPNSVTSIGEYAFYNCSGLTGSLTIGNSVTSIGNRAFSGCGGLTGTLTIPNSVTSIGNYAFSGCSGFDGSLTISNSVTSIGQYAFSGCSGLTGSLTIPNSVTSIGISTFSGCSGLTGSLTIPNSVASIGNYAFSGCSGFDGSLTIPNSVTSIGQYAFQNCSGLTGSLTIPNSVTSIGNLAFYGCSGLTGSLTIPNSVTSIGSSAFAGCSGLTGLLTIGSSVTSIGNYAFSNCSGINAIRMQCAPPAIYDNTFADVDKTIPVFVPCGTQEDYATADYWSEFEAISESPYNLIVTQNDPLGGEVSVVHYADCDDNHCAILAINNIGYNFVGWFVNDYFSTDLPYCDFSLIDNVTFEARFERRPNHFITIVTSTSNIWSDPDTWDTGEVPSSTSTVAVYKDIIVDVDAEVSELGVYEDNSITISPDVTLTVTDTLGSDNVASIAIEDGGQLIHSSDEAMATVKKSIEPYTTNADGWNLISFPLTDNGTVASVGNMLTNQYDLYAYDEPTHYWINQKDENNSFTTLEAGKGYLYANMGTGIGAAGSKIGVGTSTISYVPLYTYYKYNIAENLFLASELEAAGLPTTKLGGLCWYATNAPGYEQSNISIWMANVNDEALTTTSHNVSEMILVYTGNMTPVVGWNAFVFNENNFAWDGVSNVLVCVQRNNGEWNATINWQAHNPGFAATSYKYTDNAAYDMTSTTYSMNVSSTLRPNIVFQTLEQAGEFEYYEPVTMSFAGEIENGAAAVSIPLSYTETADNLAGFNLVGNPFVHNVTSYAATNVAEGCFRMNEAKDNLIVSEVSETQPLKPAEGFFVKATAEGASITFNAQTRGETKRSGFVNLELNKDSKLIDRLIVKREGEPLEKLSLKENGTRIFATNGNQEMAVVVAEGNEQPINFKAEKNGTYTINVNVENMDLDYLHLIDNLTGNDVDLLPLCKGGRGDSQPAYTFEAKTTDYASRFKLVFVCGDANIDNDFAFFSNGSFVINNEGQATLQVVDVMGHIIKSETINGCANVNVDAAPGVYMLRLVNGENVRVQKVVVR